MVIFKNHITFVKMFENSIFYLVQESRMTVYMYLNIYIYICHDCPASDGACIYVVLLAHEYKLKLQVGKKASSSNEHTADKRHLITHSEEHPGFKGTAQ